MCGDLQPVRLLDDSALQQRAALSAALDGTNQSAPASASLVRVGRRYCSVYQLGIEGARLQSTRGGDAAERRGERAAGGGATTPPAGTLPCMPRCRLVWASTALERRWASYAYGTGYEAERWQKALRPQSCIYGNV